ncbi:uncharacterized protein BCR38DRAFT_488071 [Pseudomassariella vexata]|uniref:BTB domain-containing protein n=1 Tax=Pseudomassariella vexata TaxID=1141098 RepID=A0A1Y2DP04_9PEZI|nr:uncharacterized protein BCR38DRAFT_488071 [Pseudomassariella vexata]ORY61013.1 hypothetical protein BCR38DRAFT_488071 [Pseudomassariella vexata]
MTGSKRRRSVLSPDVIETESCEAVTFGLRDVSPRHVPARRVTIDSDGDLLLVVGEDSVIEDDDRDTHKPTTFKVCSKALSRASPVFKRLLYGGFAESRRSDTMEWVVRLPEDKPNAMQLLLDILHSRFDQVPDREDGSTRLQDIADLTVLTDKYGLASCLRPWARDWIAPLVTDFKAREDSPDLQRNRLGSPMDERLWIMWELGHRVEFERLTRELMWFTSLDADSYLVDTQSQPPRLVFERIMEPSGACEVITAGRLELITSLLQPFHQWVEYLMTDSPDDRHPDNKKDSMLGATIRSFKRHDFWPLPDAAIVTDSASALGKKLFNMCDCLYQNTSSGSFSKEMREMRDKTQAFLKKTELPIEIKSAQVRHLEAQAKKTGLGGR